MQDIWWLQICKTCQTWGQEWIWLVFRKWLNWRRSILCGWKGSSNLLMVWQNVVRQLLYWWKSVDPGFVSKSSKPAKCKYCKYCVLVQEVRWWTCSHSNLHKTSVLAILYVVKTIGQVVNSRCGFFGGSCPNPSGGGSYGAPRPPSCISHLTRNALQTQRSATSVQIQFLY